MSRLGRLLRTFGRRSAPQYLSTRPTAPSTSTTVESDGQRPPGAAAAAGPADDQKVLSAPEDVDKFAMPEGQRIGHYVLLERLGAGGMGVVYKAQDTRLGRFAALKFLTLDSSQDDNALSRFRLEARTASALNHSNICTIYDIGESQFGTYIAMEFLEGSSLREYLRHTVVPPDRLCRIGMQIANGLESAHSHGIIHRDIKPENLFLTPGDQVKILDFGIAKLQRPRTPRPDSEITTQSAQTPLTELGLAVGTTAYMSPEQARAEDVDCRTDLFSFGAVLFEMAARRRAFPGRTSSEVYASVLTDSPSLPHSVPPGLRTPLQAILDKALEKRREFRYQHASDLGTDLRRLGRDLEKEPLYVRRGNPAPPLLKQIASDLAKAAALALLAFTAYSIFDGRASGKYLKQFQLALVQESLQHGNLGGADFEAGGRHLPLVIDISALHPEKRLRTERRLLDALIEELRKHDARAIGVDLKFDDLQADDFKYFDKWLAHGNVRLGVYGRATERREAWLGRPEFSPLAAGIALSADNPQHAYAYSRRWFAAPPEGDQAVPATQDCSEVTVDSPCKEDLIQLPVALWLLGEAPGYGGEDLSSRSEVEARLKQLLDAPPPSPQGLRGDSFEFGTYVIDYSYLSALRRDVITIPNDGNELDKLKSYFQAYGSRVTDRVVLIGDLEDTADQFCQTQGMKPLSGVLVHACSLATLNRGALLQATGGPNRFTRWLLSLLLVAVIVALRVCHTVSRSLRIWPFQQVEIVLFTGFAVATVLVCRWLAHTRGVVWPNFLWIAAALAVYPFALPFGRAFLAFPTTARSVCRAYYRRLVGG